ncbi:MAG: biotin/lipoyl-binding protein [Eubacteriales bacterium]|nr:biotin/lipoyl-binding protein [Eubacteriales bacterium]
MKKFALKGLAVLAIAVALCMFFAGTVRTIVTPKVKIVQAQSGRLEQSIALKGEVAYPETEEMRIEAARGKSLVVTRVNVRAGYQVKKGDVLFEMEMPDFDEQMDKLKKEYEEKAKKLTDLDITNRKLKRSNPRNTAYDAMNAAHRVLLDKRLELTTLCEQEGIKLPEETGLDEMPAYVEGRGASAQLKRISGECAEAYAEATKAEANLFAMLKDRKTRGKEGVWAYLKERSLAAAEQAQAEQALLDLAAAKAHIAKVVAPRDAYVAQVGIKVGDSYDGKAAPLTINKAGAEPVLRADVSEIRQAIEVGATVTVKGDWQELETQVVNTGIDLKGKKYVDVKLTSEIVETRGGMSTLMLGETEMTISYRAKESRTLLPASAVRSEGEKEHYVWQIRQEYGGFTGERMTIAKMPVTVLQRGGKVVSIAEDLYDLKVADMEDRAIKDGDTVMEYVN